MSSTCYTGPAGVTLTPDELLTLWSELCRHPTPENKSIRDKIKTCLEFRAVDAARNDPAFI